MQPGLPKRALRAILPFVAYFVGSQSIAGTLNDLESSSVSVKPEFQNAAVEAVPKFLPPSSKDVLLYPKLFGSSEKASADLSIFPKWTNVLSRYAKEKQWLEMDCSRLKDGECPTPVRNWVHFIQGQQGKGAIEILEAVNNYMNRIRYVPDSKVWDTSDYWETPLEFLQKNSGDCEDYAIAKFISLRMLGVPNHAMRIVVLNDRNIKAIHAVLVVYLQGKAYILDNQIKQIVTSDAILHYQPIYSINENEWWRHRAS